MKVKAMVSCLFEIEYEDNEEDLDTTHENIEMSTLEELICYKTDSSIECITVKNIGIV